MKKKDDKVVTLRPKGNKQSISDEPEMRFLKRMMADGEVDTDRVSEHLSQEIDVERINELEAEITKLKRIIQEKDSEIADLNKDIEQFNQVKAEARNIDGWTVRLTQDGYYRLYKSFKGKVYSIHIGKELDNKKAKEKIQDKLKQLKQKGVLS